jgi:hypothetical protein
MVVGAVGEVYGGGIFHRRLGIGASEIKVCVEG